MNTQLAAQTARVGSGCELAAERIRSFFDEGLFRALSDPARREIVLVLGVEGEMRAGQIAERFGLERTTVSRHLGVLCQAGLLECRREGRERYYRVDVEHIIGQLEGLVGTLRTDCLGCC